MRTLESHFLCDTHYVNCSLNGSNCIVVVVVKKTLISLSAVLVYFNPSFGFHRPVLFSALLSHIVASIPKSTHSLLSAKVLLITTRLIFCKPFYLITFPFTYLQLPLFCRSPKAKLLFLMFKVQCFGPHLTYSKFSLHFFYSIWSNSSPLIL